MSGGPVLGGGPLGVIIPTVLRMTDDAVKYWTSMTCLYDPYWQENPNKPTLPICMFHVKKVTPVYAVEASKKRVILYEPRGMKEPSKPMRKGVMQTVVDNAVKQPTTYNMEIIVPFQPVGRYVGDGTRLLTEALDWFDRTIGSPARHQMEEIFTPQTLQGAMQTLSLLLVAFQTVRYWLCTLY